jgi:hypothetical protein
MTKQEAIQMVCLHGYRRVDGKLTCVVCHKVLKIGSGLDLDHLDKINPHSKEPV